MQVTVSNRRRGWEGRLARMILSGFVALLAACQTPRDTGDVTDAKDLPRLAGDLAPLKKWFARGSGRPRVLALLSPT